MLVLDRVASGLKDAGELFEMAREENDDDTLAAVQADIAAIEKEVSTLEFRRMFNNPADPSNCFIDIQAGAGGTEACDWASMLLRQYLKYAERKGFKAELLEESEGDVAGIKSASIKIEGDYAYGTLRTETGVHRLVRKSPFDSSGGRHTSLRQRVRLPGSRRLDRESTSTRPTCASTPTARPAPAASTSTRPTPRCASPTCPPTSWCSARTTARSTRTAPRRCRC